MVLDRPNWSDLQALLMPYAGSCTASLNRSGNDLVYYTSAETGFKILTNKEIWLRNALVLNDFSEIEYGDARMRFAWEVRGIGGRLGNAVDKVYPGLCTRVWTYYCNRFANMRHNTYMACVSEHHPDEDVYGRLSMWRAYGGRSGVALVISKNVINADNPAVQGVFSSPVGYFDDNQFQKEFEVILENFSTNPDIVARYNKEFVTIALLRTLQFATLSTKHPAFREEREWRLLYLPHEIGNSPQIKEDYETIGGVPQTVHKLAIPDMTVIRRVIVGPCDQPIAIQNAMVSALQKHGIGDASSKVMISGVPLRHPSHA